MCFQIGIVFKEFVKDHRRVVFVAGIVQFFMSRIRPWSGDVFDGKVFAVFFAKQRHAGF